MRTRLRTVLARRRAAGASAGTESAASGDEWLEAADRLVAQGRIVEAVDLLSAAHRATSDPRIAVRVRDLRHAATLNTDPGPSPSPWPPSFDDPFPDAVGHPPEINRRDLRADVLGGAIAHHGALIVRGLFDDEDAAAGLAAIKRSLAAASDRDPTGGDSPWYRPFETSSKMVAVLRDRFFEQGNVWLADSPSSAALFLESLGSAGVLAAVTEHFGERPWFSLQKSVLRRFAPVYEPIDWHQDGSFLGTDVRSINVWVALSRCGGDYPSPGLEIVPMRIGEVIPPGGGYVSIGVAPARVEELARTAPLVRPEFAPGDAMLFDERLLHRTYLTPDMTEPRYALECWFFAPSRFTEAYLPFLA